MDSLRVVIILVILPGVWSGDWRVTLESQCALKGTSVVIQCSYDYPFGHIVTSTSWSKVKLHLGSPRLFALSQFSAPSGHFKYLGNKRGDCDLKINDVQIADTGSYYFSFVTTLNRWRSQTHSYLSVKELTTVVQPSTVTEGDDVRLTCVSGCPNPTTIVWFKDGQPVSGSVFQARIEDAGRYYCAVQGQETARSASVALNVQYAPKKVTLTVSSPGDVVKGDTVTFRCSSDANPPVTERGYSLYKDGQFISSGQKHSISDVQPGHSGRYYCQAWNNITWRGNALFNSAEVHLDVQYPPMNVSVSVAPQQVLEGSSVNLTCSSDANPPADSYAWYKTAVSGSMLQMGSGQMLFLPSMEASHNGLYLCLARNSVGENNSTEVLLVMAEKLQTSPSIAVLVGIGVALCVTLMIVLLLFWKKQRTNAGEKQTEDPSDEPSDSVYANILMSPSSAPQRNSHPHASTSYEDEILYATVNIKPKNTSRAAQDSWSKAGENSDSVIYASVVTSR
ncbi:B-cell receptor CD22-like isoform X1 [Stegastes partitus]|uniref:B-cell receptor CD22-like n=1 Tax=Stegastes partitus TaxID=144197 RepID=A0A3B5ASZ8_9TELE|nr:PREDICTED: B-cell receptor CD22-like isoform X1 [Stegastes partitus]